MKLNREVKIGIVMLASFLILLWGMNFLKGRDLFLAGNKYYGVYSRVDGLTDASPIYYKGFKIGTVRDIKIHPTNRHKFVVTFTITEKVTFADNTIAELYSLDIMGAKAIQIKPGTSSQSLTPGDTLISEFRIDFVDQMSDQMLPLKDKTEKLIVKLDSSLTQMSTFFDADTKKYFDTSVRDLSITMKNMANISQALNQQLSSGGNAEQIVQHLNGITAMLDSRKENMGKAIDNFTAISQSLSQAQIDQSIKTLDSTLTSLMVTIEGLNKGEGTLGKALKDDELYNNMAEATDNLNNILLDVKANPKRYMSFSAIHIGRKVALTETLASEITFSVMLTTSVTPLPIANTELESGQKIKEELNANTYQYTAGAFKTYLETESLLEKAKITYPNAEIIAKENGQPIDLNKAIRKTKQL